MKTFIIAITFLFSTGVFSQSIVNTLGANGEFTIRDNPYDQAGDEIKSKKSFQRERYFYEQRMFPDNSIPKDAYNKAYEQKKALRKKNNGYAMKGIFDTWINMGPTPGYLGNSGYSYRWGNVTSRISTLKYDPNNGNIIYIGGAYGGVWKSTDSGATWTAKTENEVSLASGSIAIDPSNSNIIYYGTGEANVYYTANKYLGSGLLKSTNGGDTWVNITSGLPSSTTTSRIAIRPNNSDQLLAAMGLDGLYRSTDSGESWSQLVSGRCDDVVFSPTGDAAYIVGIGTGYRVSVDGGATFTSNNSLPMGSNRNHIAICKSSPDILYCATYDQVNGIIKFYKSTDSGLTFNMNFSISDRRVVLQPWYNFYLYVSPFNSDDIYLGLVDIYRSTNGGNDFESFQNLTRGYSGGNVHADQHNMDFHPTDPNQIICANDGGISRSTNNGINWTNLNTNQTLTQFYRIAADPSNGNHIIGGTQDNGMQMTFGTINWTDAFGGDGGDVCFHTQNNSYLLAETQFNNVYRSSNGGVNWTTANSGLSGQGAMIAPIISHPTDAGVFYTARMKVFKTTNWGENWTAISTGTRGIIREMAISKTQPEIIYASAFGTIFKSLDSGITFAVASSGLPGRTITSICVDPEYSTIAYATISGFGPGHFYRTVNGGISWEDISGDLPDSPANDAFIYSQGGGSYVFYVATDIGVFSSTNSGTNWSELAAGLPNTVAIHLDYNQSVNKLRVGTHGRGVWEITPDTTLGLIPALSTYSQDTIRATLTLNSTQNKNLVIGNTGGSDLYWNIESRNAVYSGKRGDPEEFKNANINRTGRDNDFIPWLEASPDSGTILPSENQKVNLIFNSNGLPEGIYTGNLRFSTNDPYNPLKTIPVIMEVITPLPMDIKFVIQGFYYLNTLKIRDTSVVYLRNTTAPYDIVDSSVGVIDSLTFSGSFLFVNAPTDYYYLQVKSRNGIETWSEPGGVFYNPSNPFSYNFTIASSKAYGNNQIQVDVSPLVYAIFSGDENQNGIVDLSDVVNVSNAASSFTSGYFPSDMNGDNVTDLSDVVITSNNASAFVAKIVP